ncbi:MAG: hypothetical protein JWQ35_1916 [Bacteriovoracaceae bacterium]|nr:hypothetical protein [Bacteriovoracaceae bacterium]
MLVPKNGMVSELGNQISPAFFDKEVWTIKDVHSVLQCSERHIRELVSSGKIPYVKVGRLVRFYRTDLFEWLKKGGTR